MDHTIEPATSGRAKCRGCGRSITKGELRLGERLPNPFSTESLMTHWFHLQCAAYKRPEILLEVLDSVDLEINDRTELIEAAQFGVEHRRLPRIDRVERSPSGRARCRCCREAIGKDEWRAVLVFYEEGRFNPSGFVHVSCSEEYFGTANVVDRMAHFTPDLSDADALAIKSALDL